MQIFNSIQSFQCVNKSNVTSVLKAMSNHFNSLFYHSFNDFELSGNDNSNDNATNNELFLQYINLLNNKLIVCDVTLILLFEIFNKLNNHQTLMNEFINVLQECAFNCLNVKNARNYFYFKELKLLLSNTLLCKYYSNNNNELLFDMIEKSTLVDSQLMTQKNIFIIIFQMITIIIGINWYYSDNVFTI